MHNYKYNDAGSLFLENKQEDYFSYLDYVRRDTNKRR